VTPPKRCALASLAALALTACQAPPSTGTSTRAKPQPHVEAVSAVQTPPAQASQPPPPALGSTRVYLVIGNEIVRFDERGAATLSTDTPRVIADLFEGPDAAVYVRDASALHRIEGEQLVEVLRFPAEIGTVHHLALGRDGSTWVVADQGVGMRTGDTWKLTSLAELELDSSAKLAFDSEQILWVVAARRALYRDGERFIAAPVEMLAPGYALLNPLGSPVGPVHVSNHHLLTRLGKESFESVVIDAKTRVSYIADLDIAPDGYACVATDTCALACANSTPPTIIWRFPVKAKGRGGASEQGKGYSCESVYELGVEASHRVWVASPKGLHLVLPDREAHEFSVAEHPLLAGSVTHMVVVE
jgi:hypothetical protein